MKMGQGQGLGGGPLLHTSVGSAAEESHQVEAPGTRSPGGAWNLPATSRVKQGTPVPLLSGKSGNGRERRKEPRRGRARKEKQNLRLCAKAAPTIAGVLLALTPSRNVHPEKSQHPQNPHYKLWF